MNVTLLSQARGLADRGISVDLLTRATGEPEVRELSPGVTLRSLAAGPPREVAKSKLPDVADAFGEAVADLVGRTAPRYDLLHAHYWLSGLAVLPVAIELGLPMVQSFHTLAAMKNASLAPGDSPEPDRRLFSEMFLANQADAIVVGSSAEVDTLMDGMRASADKLWVIPPGVDTSLFAPDRIDHSASIRHRLGLGGERPLIVVAGRIQPLKGQDLAIEVLARVQSPGALTPLLVFAGEATAGSEAYRASLNALAAGLGVAGDLRFVGALDQADLADLLAAATLTLIPSHSETFGLVALESASSGTPVVGYRSTGLVESVADGSSGVLVDSRDPGEWAATVSRLLADDAELARLGASARGHAEGYTWATAAASLLGVYEGLLAR
jgi:D-inositol-3-phosphate glycosyltransferase